MPKVDPHEEEVQRRIREHLTKLLAQDDTPFTENGPVRNPVDRFAHLPENTRRWLEDLRQEDLDDLDEILVGYRGTRTIVKFFKWFIISLVGGFVAAWALGEQVLKILSSFKGVH